MIAQATWLVQNFPFILAGICGIGFVIAFHELGHFIFCKLFNVHVPSFSIGFGPQLLKKKIGETTFSLSLIPVGGYVEAEMGQTENISLDRTIDVKPYWQKMLIAWGGILFNLIFAYVALVCLSMSGIPSNPFIIHNGSYKIKTLVEGSPAHKAGLQSGDRLLTINDIDVSKHINKLFEVLEPLAHKPAVIRLERAGTIQRIELIVGHQKVKDIEKGILGIKEFLFPSLAPTSFFASFVQAAQLLNELVITTIKGFTHAFKKRSAENFSGPLMMITMTIASAGQGIKLFLIFLTIISISLAVLNLIPLPILDGGRIMTYTIEAIIRRPLPDSIQLAMHYASWLFVGLFFVYLTVKDIQNLF